MTTSRPAGSAGAETLCEGDVVRGSVYAQALPIWAKQVESARRQTEEAIVALSERFEGIVNRLDRALGDAGTESGPRDC